MLSGILINALRGRLIMEEKIKQKKHTKNEIANFLLNNKALLLLFMALITCTAISEHFLSLNNIRNVLRQNAASCILGLGFTCILSAGNIDLSVGYMTGMLGVIAALIDTRTSIPFGITVLIVLGAGVFCGFVNGLIGMTIKMPMFIITLATGQFFRGVCYVISNNTPVTGVSDSMKFLGQGYVGVVPVPVILMVISGVAIYIILNKSIVGRWAVAMGGNAEAARISGINISRITIVVYVLLGLCCSLASLILTGRAVSAQPTAGAGMEMDAIAAVVIGGTSMSGGKAKVIGTFFGVMLVGVLNNVLNLLGIDSNYQYMVKAIMIIVAVTLDSCAQKYFDNQLKKAVK